VMCTAFIYEPSFYCDVRCMSSCGERIALFSVSSYFKLNYSLIRYCTY